MTYRKAKPFVVPSDPIERAELWNRLQPCLRLEGDCWSFSDDIWESAGLATVEGKNGPTALVALKRPGLPPQHVSPRRVIYALYKGNFEGNLHALPTCIKSCCNPEHLKVQKQTSLTIEIVQEIRRLYGTPVLGSDGEPLLQKNGFAVLTTQTALAKRFGVSIPTVYGIVNYKTWNRDPIDKEFDPSIKYTGLSFDKEGVE